MRRLLLPLCLVPAAAQAQHGIDLGVRGAFSAMREHNLLPQIDQKNPLEPKGFTNPPDKYDVLPPPAEDPGAMRIIKGRLHMDGPHGEQVHLSDGAEFVARGYHITADRADGNTRTGIYTLKGHVHIDGKGSTIVGDDITVDLLQSTFVGHNVESQIPPNLSGGQLRGNLYVKGRESYGSQREIFSNNGDVTTCDLPNPHYDIVGESTDVRPGKRAIFRKAKIRLFGRTILKIPYLVIPLDDRTYRNLPDFGTSPEEGYYVKNRYALPLKGDRYLETREDEMTKLGTGLGLGYNYRLPDYAGTTRIYRIFGKVDTMTISSIHNQLFKWGTLNLQNDFEKDNYLTAPGTTTLNTRALVTIPQGQQGSDRITLSRMNSDASGFSTVSQNVGVSDTRDLGGRTRTDLNLNYLDTSSSYVGGTPSKREQLDVQFKASKELDKATAGLDYQRSIPIGDTRNFYSGSDQTPVLSLSSDAKRLMGTDAAKVLPFKTEVSFGEFQDSQATTHISRSMLDFNFQKPGDAQNRFRTDLDGRFRQGIYSDGTAQYLLNMDSALTYGFGRDTSANLRYSYLRPYGYSPLQIDRTGQTNFVSADVSVRPIRTFLAGVQTSYDILRLQQQETGWQQVGVRLEYQPVKTVLMRASLPYDPNRLAWTSMRFDLNAIQGDQRLSFGTLFDGVQHTFSQANLSIDSLKMGRTKFSTILNYNGYTKRFDSAQYSFIYDLHCAEAMLTVFDNNVGFRTGRQIIFNIRLKALPFAPPFGFGTQGQAIGTGTGRSF